MNRTSNVIHLKKCLIAAGLALICSSGSARAQDTNSPPETDFLPDTNETVQIEQMLSDEMIQHEPEVIGEEATDHIENADPAQNQPAVPPPMPDARSRRSDRLSQYRSRSEDRRSDERGSEPYRGQTYRSQDYRDEPTGGTNAVSPLDFAAFRLITERNIFDPNRRARRGPPPSRPRDVDAFTLVGTMNYSKGDFAFFDGTSSSYRKVLKVAGTIAGYTVQAISPESVKLVRENKQLELAVGTQLRRQDDGTWVQATRAGSYAADSSSSPDSSSSTSSSSGADSDVLKRLMERRQKSMN